MKLKDVSRNYDHLAPFYDLGDRWISQPIADMASLRTETVARLYLRPGDRVLDIGCGTGLNLPLLLRTVGATGQVCGLDYSAGMLAQARKRVREAGWENVDLILGDAADLAGVAGPFDAVISTWALGIVDDLPAALKSAVSALRPGGRLAVLDLHRTRAPSGLRRTLVDPILHALLRWSGADSPEDLDDERLRKRWAAGKAYLRDALLDVNELDNVEGAGFLLWGRAPGATQERLDDDEVDSSRFDDVEDPYGSSTVLSIRGAQQLGADRPHLTPTAAPTRTAPPGALPPPTTAASSPPAPAPRPSGTGTSP